MADGMMRVLFAFGLALYSLTGYGENLPDPTRPPAMLLGDGTTSTPHAVAKRPSGLQSTIISSSRRAAIIDGVTVELWAQHGNERLIEVNEGSVVLKSARARRVLTLFPDIRMTNVSSAPRATGEKK